MTPGEAMARQIEAECHNLAALEREQHRPTPPPLWNCPMCHGGVPQEMIRAHLPTCTGLRRRTHPMTGKSVQ